MIQPQNCPEDVQQFCQLLRLDPDRRFLLKPAEPGRCCLLLLSLPAGTGQPPESWPSLELCFSFALDPINRELGVADGYRTSAWLAAWGLSFPPSAVSVGVPCSGWCDSWVAPSSIQAAPMPCVIAAPSPERGGSCSLPSPRPVELLTLLPHSGEPQSCWGSRQAVLGHLAPVLALRITESQNVQGWKGPLWVTQSNPTAEAGSPTAGCTGPCPGRSGIPPEKETPQPLSSLFQCSIRALHAALPYRHIPPCPVAAALHHPTPGHPLPGHLLRAATLLLRALVLLLYE